MAITLTKFLEKSEKLRLAQQSFFLLGYTLNWLGDKEFPFQSEEERALLWRKHKAKLFSDMYEPSKSFPAAREPEANALRPREFWKRDETKLILNGAKFLRESSEGHSIYDGEPTKETDLEALTRLGLLTDDDRVKASGPDFKLAEAQALLYRAYTAKLAAG